MRLRVERSRCWLCDQTYNDSWIVSDERGHCLYVTNEWRTALDYACAAVQPGTGDQVHHQVTKLGTAQ